MTEINYPTLDIFIRKDIDISIHADHVLYFGNVFIQSRSPSCRTAVSVIRSVIRERVLWVSVFHRRRCGKGVQLPP